MWSECVGVCQLLNWKTHGETLKLVRNVTVWANMLSDWEIEGGTIIKHTVHTLWK